MFENHPRLTSRKGHQDLLHTLILLGTVPLLFFAALRLLEKSTDVLKEPDPVVVQSEPVVVQPDSVVVPEEAKVPVSPAVEKLSPPGDAWLRKVAELEQRAESLRSMPNPLPQRFGQCRQRLAMLRQHIEQHKDAVPRNIRSDHPLHAALQRLSDEIAEIAQPVSNHPAGLNWKEALATFDAEQRRKHTASVAREVERLTAPLKEPHRTELDAVLRELQGVADQIQTIREKELDIQSRTDRELARQTRLRAFEPVRTEALRLLSPFIAHDYVQPGEATNIWVKTLEKKPVSWRALERLGALEVTLRGLEALSSIGAQGIRNPDFRRPLGSFPEPEQGTLVRPREIETTKRAQFLLKEHGQVLIEEGLLSP